ncbi:phage tail sheath protein [Roseomonas sp. M0104]|uniref:Phage tail sheath protein n=1 Tax=Teichococcus coralli TaxID=2545983 RepID=A0A845BCN4_9PROT|nr:phage tail sheath C-terminal domain-containing protein [Pseudoroseomonas coralli]MXP65353.1 phage tail sheath protein [Pseudoroseomonas coralli]
MYQHPGVYVEHVPSGLLAVETASPSVAAFIGHLGRGEAVTAHTGKPVFLSDMALFALRFGTLDGRGGGIRDRGEAPDWFGHAVTAFFANGGRKAYIVPVGDAGPARSAKASIADPRDGAGAFYFEAASPGEWANDLFVALRRTAEDDNPLKAEYELSVGFLRDPAAPAKGVLAIERIGGLVLDPASGRYLVSRVQNTSTLVRVARKAIAGEEGGGRLKAFLGAPVPAVDLTGLPADPKMTVTVNGKAVEVAAPGGETSLAAIARTIRDRITRPENAADAIPGFSAQTTADARLLLVPPDSGSDPAVTVAGGALAMRLGLDPTAAMATPAAGLDFATLKDKTLDIRIGDGPPKTITLPEGLADLAAVAAKIEELMHADAGAVPEFRAAVQSGRLALRREGGSAANAVTVSGGSAAGDLGLTDAATATAARATVLEYPQVFDAERNAALSRLAGGADYGLPKPADYRDALHRLRDHRDIGILVLPGQHWHPGGDNSAIEAAIDHAEFMQNRLVLVDPPNPAENARLESPNDVKQLGAPTSPYAVLYYPWLTVANPHYDPDTAANRPKTFEVGPGAFAAGMWARIDAARGPWKAPAGLEAELRGTLGPNVLIGNDLQDNLNEWGVNCLRAIIGPTVIWGARTLATKTKPEFRYISVRRTQSMIGESLYNALQAMVFEPNDHRLWASLRAAGTNFMEGLYRAGAFQGEKASDAFYVRCGLDATMTQGDIDAGIVRLVVGFAPLKPAEFVVVQIQQIVGRTA